MSKPLPAIQASILPAAPVREHEVSALRWLIEQAHKAAEKRAGTPEEKEAA